MEQKKATATERARHAVSEEGGKWARENACHSDHYPWSGPPLHPLTMPGRTKNRGYFRRPKLGCILQGCRGRTGLLIFVYLYRPTVYSQGRSLHGCADFKFQHPKAYWLIDYLINLLIS